nr:heparan-alpha-glucosaminide N-acetyltransferase domain-containing protein [Candidatus Prometheoarchaeum syntrophicum]QEE15571.1 hypothetical protein DSAG12_01397 [Candidatus Prometheoarchaeum syntrophicum]
MIIIQQSTYQIITNSIDKKVLKHSRRLKSLDSLRGFAIFCMVLFHGFQLLEMDLLGVASALTENPVAKVIEFMARMAGIFVFISGISNSMSIYSRYSKGTTNGKKTIMESFIVGLWFIILERVVYRFLDRPVTGGGIYDFDTGPTYYSYILGYLETGVFHPFPLYPTFFSSGALSMMGLSLMFYSVLLVILFHNEGYKRIHRNLLIVGILATFIIVISPFLIDILRPIWVQALIDENYGKIILVGILVGDSDPMMPFLGFALYGVAIGIEIKGKVPKNIFLLVGIIVSSIYIILGTIGYIIFGEPPVEHILRTLPIQTTHLQIGIMILIVTMLVYSEISKKDKRNTNKLDYKLKKKKERMTFLQLFGKFSLTMYLLESFFGSVIKLLILDKVFPGWAQNMALVVCYSMIIVILWFFILKIWSKFGQIGSYDWMTAQIKKRVRKTLSEKELKKNHSKF